MVQLLPAGGAGTQYPLQRSSRTPFYKPSLPLFPGLQVKWFSPFLLAVWDPEAEEFQSLCRCMSGFTDEFYADAKERLSKTIIPGKPARGNHLQTLELVLMCPFWATRVFDATRHSRSGRPTTMLLPLPAHTARPQALLQHWRAAQRVV